MDKSSNKDLLVDIIHLTAVLTQTCYRCGGLDDTSMGMCHDCYAEGLKRLAREAAIEKAVNSDGIESLAEAIMGIDPDRCPRSGQVYGDEL